MFQTKFPFAILLSNICPSYCGGFYNRSGETQRIENARDLL